MEDEDIEIRKGSHGGQYYEVKDKDDTGHTSYLKDDGHQVKEVWCGKVWIYLSKLGKPHYHPCKGCAYCLAACGAWSLCGIGFACCGAMDPLISKTIVL